MVYPMASSETGMTMKRAGAPRLCRVAALAAATAALAACATTPSYPARTGYVAPAPVQPRYPIARDATASATPAPPSAPAPEAAPTPAPTQAVESAALPPIAAAPPPPAPETAAPPPAPPEREAAHAQAEEAQSYAPAPAPEPPRMRPGPPRFIAAGKVVEAHGMFRDYQVRKHDHIDAIARELGITRKVIVEENHLDAPYAIHPGDILSVPVAKAYVVQAGDTLREIGKRFSVGVEDIAQLNHISARKDLRPGERLALPADFRDRGPIRLRPVMVADTRPPPPASRREARREREIAAAAQPPVLTPAPPSYIARPAPPPRTTAAPSPYAAAPPRPEPRYTPLPPAPVESAQAPASGDIAQAARGHFIWPLRGGMLSTFGVKGLGRRNDGVDIGAPMGTVVRAAAGGDVVYAGNQVPGFGNLVLVKHADGWVTAYAHLDTVSVKMRQEVSQGQELGVVGQSGGVSEPQLHFEMRYAATPQDKAKPIDPMLVLPQ